MKYIRIFIVNFWIKFGELFSFMSDIVSNFVPDDDWDKEKDTFIVSIVMWLTNKYGDCIYQSLELNNKWNLDIWTKYNDFDPSEEKDS